MKNNLEKEIEISEHDFLYLFVLGELTKKKREYVTGVKERVDFLKEIGCDIRFYYNPVKGVCYFKNITDNESGIEYKKNPLGFKLSGGEQDDNKNDK